MQDIDWEKYILVCSTFLLYKRGKGEVENKRAIEHFFS
jgi:hypothetical protein